MADKVIPPLGAADRVKAAAREAGIGPAEPLGPVIEAIADIPADIAAMLKRHAAQVSAASTKPPITVEDIQTLNRAAAKQGVGEVVYAVKALTAQNYWKLSAMGALALVVYGLVCWGGGFAAGWRWTFGNDRTEINAAKHMMIEAHDGLPAMPAQDLAKWLDLIRLNPNIAARFERCDPLPQPNGGSACNLPIWTLPPQPRMATPGTH